MVHTHRQKILLQLDMARSPTDSHKNFRGNSCLEDIPMSHMTFDR